MVTKPAPAHTPEPAEPTRPAAAKAQAPSVAPQEAKQPLSADRPAATQGATVSDAGEVAALWGRTMDALKGYSVRLHAFMKPAIAESLQDGVLTLRFPEDNAFHYNQMNTPQQRSMLGELFRQTSGQNAQIHLVLSAAYDPTDDLIERSKELFNLSDDNIKLIDE